MMNKPTGFDDAQAFGEFETLPAGGYVCALKKVVCEKTQMGKEYLKIGFDIAEGKYTDFYQRKFDGDTRKDKKWSGVWAVFIEGFEPDTTNPKFKGLITSVENSNNGFKFDFDEQKLVGKKVGIVFREEEFIGQDGLIHTAVKPFYAVPTEKVNEVKIPNKKLLTENAVSNNSSSDDLPF